MSEQTQADRKAELARQAAIIEAVAHALDGTETTEAAPTKRADPEPVRTTELAPKKGK